MIIFFNDVFYHQAFSKNEAFIDIFNDNFDPEKYALLLKCLVESDTYVFHKQGQSYSVSLCEKLILSF